MLQLLEAFEKGELKPGLNVKTTAPRQYANNTVSNVLQFAMMWCELAWGQDKFYYKNDYNVFFTIFRLRWKLN